MKKRIHKTARFLFPRGANVMIFAARVLVEHVIHEDEGQLPVKEAFRGGALKDCHQPVLY